MRQDKIVELSQGFRTAFINQNEQSNLAYKPQFVSNNYKEDREFNEKGWRTLALSGNNSESMRAAAIKQLPADLRVVEEIEKYLK